MSITLGTLVILFFLIPGLIVRKSFFVLPFDKRYSEGKSITEFSYVLNFSFSIHYIGLMVLKYYYPNYYLEFLNFFDLIYTVISTNNPVQKPISCTNLNVIIVTQFILWVVATLLGFFFNSIIRYFKWDRKYRSFRFGNSWYYYFSGEAIEFPDIDGDAKEIDYVFVDVLLKAEGREILYIGVLSEYQLSENGGLKSIALKGTKRRFMEDNNDSYISSDQKMELTEAELLSKYYTIPSNLFIIPYNENVLNINFRYFGDDVLDDNDSDNTSVLEKIITIISFAIIIIIIYSIFNKLFNKMKSGKKMVKDTDSESKENN